MLINFKTEQEDARHELVLVIFVRTLLNYIVPYLVIRSQLLVHCWFISVGQVQSRLYKLQRVGSLGGIVLDFDLCLSEFESLDLGRSR